MKLRLLFIATLLIFHIDSFAQFEKNSLHATASLSDYFQYGGRLSYFPAKNLELGIGGSFRTREGQSLHYPKRTRWSVSYKMNYYISNWFIKPKIVAALTYSKNNQKKGIYYLPNLATYQAFNAGLGIGVSVRLHKRIRLEGDIIYSKFTYKPSLDTPIYDTRYSSKFLSEVSLSYQISKLK